MEVEIRFSGIVMIVFARGSPHGESELLTSNRHYHVDCFWEQFMLHCMPVHIMLQAKAALIACVTTSEAQEPGVGEILDLNELSGAD